MLSAEIKKVFRQEFLSQDETQEIINKIANEERYDVQIAVLLSLLSVRGPSIEEMIGFVKGMRSKTIKTYGKVAGPIIDTCGTGGDGRKTFNVSTLSALWLSACGIKVAKHGNRSITSHCGSADLLEGLGVNINMPVEMLTQCLETVGMAFFFAPLFHPVMKILAPIRKQMSIPTLFNSMGPLLNPIKTDYQIMGLYHEDTEKIARILQALGLRGGMVVHGHDGMDEISLCAPTKITEFTTDELKTYDFDPHQYGFSLVKGEDLSGGDLETNLRIAQEVINPTLPLNPCKQVVILNAAAGIKIVKGVDFAAAIQTASETLKNGAVQKKLQELIDFSNK